MLAAVSVALLYLPQSALAHPTGDSGTHDHTLTVEILGDGEGKVTSNNGSINCLSSSSTNCSRTYTKNFNHTDDNAITLTATPEPGSSFGGWGRDCPSSTSTTCRVTVGRATGNTDIFATATFDRLAPTITLSPNSGSPRTTNMNISGSNFTAGTYPVFFDGRTIGSITVGASRSPWYRSFPVPWSGSGSKTIRVDDATATFAVESGVTLSPFSGPVGSEVTVTGEGFGVDHTNIQVRFGTQLLNTILRSDREGSVRGSFMVPALPAGQHSVTVGSADSATFTITSDLALDETSGPPGATVSITGSGFAANSFFNLNFNGQTLRTVTVDGGGRVSASFQVPEAPGGPNSVGLGGKSLSFTVTPSLAVGNEDATPGATVTVSGSGYYRNERGITVTVGGSEAASGIRADANGSWTSPIVVPSLAAGSHRVSAHGTSTTRSNAPSAFLVLGSQVSLDKSSGPPGSKLKVSGSGFTPGESVRIAVGANLAPRSVRANGRGSWTAGLEVPASPGGRLVVSATGAGGKRTETEFTVSAQVSLSHQTAPPGSPVTASGTGFPANAGGLSIKFADAPVASASADSHGSFSRPFTVPQSAAGVYSVSVSGAGPTVRAPLSVTPKITVNDSGAEHGGTVTVRGSGFGANEQGITVTLQERPVAAGIAAGVRGSWTASFEMPSLPSGVYAVKASGPITPFDRVPEVTLSISAHMVLDRDSGPPGEDLQISGRGFDSRDGVTITAGDGLIQATTVADNAGSWSINIKIPIAQGGRLAIKASGAGGQTEETDFTVTPVASLSEPFGHPGSAIEIAGHGFEAGQSLAVSFENTSIASPVADSLGSWTANFMVPPSPAGSYLMLIKGGGIEIKTPFLVTASISLSATQAGPTELISVTGSGFGASERGISISVDRNTEQSGISAGQRGSWTTEFTVPSLPRGDYEVLATGPTASSSSSAQEFLTIIPMLDMSPAQGGPGTQVNVTGRGFAKNQRDVKINFDNKSVAVVPTADDTGSFKATFEVPRSPSGLYPVRHSGNTAAQDSDPGTGFQVIPIISLDKQSGPPGTVIQVSGVGFPANHPGIIIAYDGTPQVAGVPANGLGSFTASVEASASTGGIHKITAVGTGLAGLANPVQDFEVTQSLDLSNDSGNIGDELRVTGLGFAPESTVTLAYGDGILNETTETNASGTFELELIVPASSSGEHLIIAGDDQGFSAVVTFTVEDTPAPLPVLLLPEDNASGGMFGGFRPDLSWGPVEDPSGVTYDLQLSDTPEFTAPILEKTGLATPEYSLTDEEALSRGKYYWRVRAVDQADNASLWTGEFEVKSGIIPAWLLPVLGILLAVLAGGGGYTNYRRRRYRLASRPAFPELAREVRTAPALPSTAAAAGTAPAPRPQPRLALPSSPLRRRRTRSPEEQAQLRMVYDFLQSIPLLQVTSNLSWLDELVEAASGTESVDFERVLEGQIDLGYQPTWVRHPTFQTVQQVLQGHPFLQELEAFVEAADGSAVDTVALLRQVYQDVDDGLPVDTAKVYRWRFVLGVLQHSLGWFRGSYLREPSARDYRTEAFAEDAEEPLVTLVGEPSTPFPGPLVEGVVEADALAYRDLHLSLRGTYTTSEDARFLASRLTSLEIIRQQLTSSLEQLGDM